MYRSVQTSGGATDGDVNITINVTSTNDAPYFNPVLPDKTITEGQALNYYVYGTDPENDLPFTFNISSDLSNILIQNTNSSAAKIMFNNSGQDISQYNDKGNHTITVTIYDNATPSLSFNDSFILQVMPTNHKANYTYVVYNNDSLIQGGQLVISINATDIDNDTITFTTSNPTLYSVEYTATNKSNPNGISSATALINISNLTNNHVIYNSFTLAIYDTKENASTSISLSITNVNDAPEIFEMSYNNGNSLNNQNLSNLIAYTGVPFTYYVNATDIDLQTYQGDSLTYSTNSSNITINSSTGKISFLKYVSESYYFDVILRDSGNLNDTRPGLVTLLPNTNPYFNQSLELLCFEFDASNYPYNCTYNISNYANDTDSGDYVNNFWTNSTLFDINTTTGMIVFTPNQTILGQYGILVNITDTRGGMNSTVLILNINNTNNAPFIDSAITLPPGRLVIQNNYEIMISASDDDLNLNTYENLTFNANVTGPNNALFQLTKTDVDQATISFNPLTTSDAGNYTVNMTVRDYYNNVSSVRSISIYIYNITSPPNITEVKPYGTPIISNSVVNAFMNRSSLGNTTNITINENSTYIFNLTATYDMTYDNFLNYSWYYDGSSVSSNTYYGKSFDFFSSGNHNVSITVTDQFNRSDKFMWNINVTNVNRPPRLINALHNLTGANAVNGSTTYDGYMTYYASQIKFYDPDDDIDLNNIDADNESTMIFNATACEYATFSFIGTSFKVTTVDVGACLVNFTASDSANSSMSAYAREIMINISEISNDTTPEVIPQSGGGGSSTRTITIPLPEEVEKPKPLQIITPRLVTVYKNSSVKVPVILNNTWNSTLEGVSLNAFTNASNVTLYLDRTFFPRLYRNKTEEITLTINNYKSEGHYEIQLTADVVNPKYKDTATIFVNSADMTSEGSELETRISFARDLLSSNPECQELTELLNEAKKALDSNNFDTTAKLVDDVINGCKYLVSTKGNIEKPSTDFISRFNWKSNYTEYLILIGFGVIFFVSLYYIFKKDKSSDF